MCLIDRVLGVYLYAVVLLSLRGRRDDEHLLTLLYFAWNAQHIIDREPKNNGGYTNDALEATWVAEATYCPSHSIFSAMSGLLSACSLRLHLAHRSYTLLLQGRD